MIDTQNFQSFVDAAQEVLAPVSRYNEFATKAMERLARKQWEVAGACLELGLEQLNSAAQTRDIQDLVSAQQQLASRWTDTLTRGSMELVEIVRENQAEALELFTKQAKDTAANVSKAAKKAA